LCCCEQKVNTKSCKAGHVILLYCNDILTSMEDNLTFEWSVWVYCSLLAAFIPIIIPAVQFGYIFKLWDKYNKPVNRNLCGCSCWDTVFKGKYINNYILITISITSITSIHPYAFFHSFIIAGYETGVGDYKHVYFNATENTLIMWTLTVMAVIGLYEAVRHIFTAIYYGCARPRMVVLFLSNIFSHYYGWWAYFNYYNDDYYKQWWHQFFFTITELASSIVVLHLVNKNNVIAIPKKLLFIMRYLSIIIIVSN
jgi:hypothetical protein